MRMRNPRPAAGIFAGRTNRDSVVARDGRPSFHAWQERIRDPSLTVLLILEFSAFFVAAPLAAQGRPVARAVGETLLLAVLVIVVMLSHRWGAILAIALGLAAMLADLLLSPAASPVMASVLERGGNILLFSALTWVVAHAVYAPGRVTFRRLQGAVVVYLNLATIFASAYRLIWELNPAAFTNLPAEASGSAGLAAMLYFSFTTLTTTGYGDIVAILPLARSLANLESVIGQLFLAITVARLVTLELEERRR
jgi:membrane-bound ClpP family serine protease